ncbi:hypothetical protein [Asaia spathodeae]|uniref:Nucleic acid-binding protein n=1 Tax=Asaia spathodeae TaxID=657016 RepID=A0ABX2P9T7_9PROT|nr:hypothetical protein [Asaia spathodeae]GBR16816.1 hypothetical protein AA105894_1665 [Asaia spathodeae NBRC 105894]
MSLAPAQIEKPDVIVPDTGPLIHLAQANALHLLHEVGSRVVVTDMVAIEATANLKKPGAAEIQNWLDRGASLGSNAPVLIEKTDVGRAFLASRQADPTFRWRGAGELAIVEWLRDKVDHTDQAVLVVYENGRVPRMVGDYGVHADIDVVTTRAFLELAQRQGIISSADDYWKQVVAAAPTANPDDVVTMHRKPRSC